MKIGLAEVGITPAVGVGKVEDNRGNLWGKYLDSLH